jgi:hypothetical protein
MLPLKYNYDGCDEMTVEWSVVTNGYFQQIEGNHAAADS